VDRPLTNLSGRYFCREGEKFLEQIRAAPGGMEKQTGDPTGENLSSLGERHAVSYGGRSAGGGYQLGCKTEVDMVRRALHGKKKKSPL